MVLPQDIEQKSEILKNEMCEYILMRLQDVSGERLNKQLQNKVMELQSTMMLSFFLKTDNQCSIEILKKIELLYKEYSQFLELEESQFLSGFPRISLVEFLNSIVDEIVKKRRI